MTSAFLPPLPPAAAPVPRSRAGSRPEEATTLNRRRSPQSITPARPAATRKPGVAALAPAFAGLAFCCAPTLAAGDAMLRAGAVTRR